MSTDFPFPMIVQDGKRYARYSHVAAYAHRPVSVVTRLVDNGDIAEHLINAQVYIDIDESLAVLATVNPRGKKPTKLIEVDLFA
jgi:hypothetical protein